MSIDTQTPMQSMTLSTDQRELEKRDRFARIFPNRIDKLRDGLRIAGNCSNTSNYAWDPSKIQLLFVLLFKEFIATAELFGLTARASINGIDVNDLPD